MFLVIFIDAEPCRMASVQRFPSSPARRRAEGQPGAWFKVTREPRPTFSAVGGPPSPVAEEPVEKSIRLCCRAGGGQGREAGLLLLAAAGLSVSQPSTSMPACWAKGLQGGVCAPLNRAPPLPCAGGQGEILDCSPLTPAAVEALEEHSFGDVPHSHPRAAEWLG